MGAELLAVGAGLDSLSDLIGGPQRDAGESDADYRRRLREYNDQRLLIADLNARVTIATLDSFPAHYIATLSDQGRVFEASAMGPGPDQIDRYGEAQRDVISGLVDDVVAQALAARKAGG